MTWRGEIIGYGKVRANKFKSIIVELLCVVRDDNPRDPKSKNDALLNKIFGVLFSDFSERLNLYPLREVVYDDNQEFAL